MGQLSKSEVAGEHALREGEPDRLGFGEVAERIANSIVDRASIDGLVIGLDGEWGSGKSSLLHLIERSLDNLPEKRRPTIINFRPWLVGNRDALLTTLFSDLADKIARVQLARGDASAVTIEKAKRTAEAVRRFARALSKTGELVETAGTLWKPLELAGKGLRAVGTMSEKKEVGPDLAALKDDIVKNLRELKHRFIITVDDVDRLEPAEVIEVLRLVRSVADFPNINYLLCYDAERLAEAIESGAKIKNGFTYLEKIVQLTVMIPKPEPFELRQWFAEELEPLIGHAADFEARERLKNVIDQEGGNHLRTPRSVVRTLDSIRFFWPAMRGENVDIADLVWLQLIKDGSPALYRWIEEYVASVAATSFGTTMISDSWKASRLQSLLETYKDHLGDLLYRHMFADILPGIEVSYDKDGPPVTIYGQVSNRDRQAAITSRRLASPDHYRLYFSLMGPSHAITQAGFDSFWAAADAGPGETAALLLELHGQRVLGPLRKSDVLFERLRAMNPQLWTEARAKNVLLALGQMMDDAYRQNPTEENFIVTSWDRAERLVPILYARIPEPSRAHVNEQLFGSGASIGWLTSVLRTEIFSHGRWGDQKKSSDQWLLPAAEFERACELMLVRYGAMSIDEIIASPRAVHILYAWAQAGDDAGPRTLIAQAFRTDQGLLNVLNTFTATAISSDIGRYTYLKLDDLKRFTDEDIAVRLENIAREGPTNLRDEAEKLLRLAKTARD